MHVHVNEFICLYQYTCVYMYTVYCMVPTSYFLPLLVGLEDVLGLAVHGSYIYWTDRGNIDFSLARADKNTGGSKEALIRNIGGFHGLIAVNQSVFPGQGKN